MEEQPTVPDKPADLLVLDETDYLSYSQQVRNDGIVVSGHQPLYESDLELVAICTYDNIKNISTVSQENLDRYKYKPVANEDEAAEKRAQLRANLLAGEAIEEIPTPPPPSTYIYRKLVNSENLITAILYFTPINFDHTIASVVYTIQSRTNPQTYHPKNSYCYKQY